jgi:hypothetical protein
MREHTIRIAQQIVNYFETRRGIGHTKAEYQGLRNVPNALLIVADHQQALRLSSKLGWSPGLLTIDQVGDNGLGGISRPVIIDHYATTRLLDRLLDHIYSLRRDRENLMSENKELRKEIDGLKSRTAESGKQS